MLWKIIQFFHDFKGKSRLLKKCKQQQHQIPVSKKYINHNETALKHS